jgi:uncharacterized membrane protein YdbT with pleckstrin-like domain
MTDAFESWVCRLLRVPPEPAAPPGEAGSIRQFRASLNFFRLRILSWFFGQAAALVGLIGGVIAIRFMIEPGPVRNVLAFFEVVAAVAFVLQVPFTFAVTRLDYRMRWYMVTDRSLRIREGVMTVDEKTVTFANIQNLQVRQGPLQRILGIADVEVTTAGGGGSEGRKKSSENSFAKDMHTAYFRGVENAEAIRDIIMARLRAHRGSGLGDPDDEHEHAPESLAESLERSASPRWRSGRLRAACDEL